MQSIPFVDKMRELAVFAVNKKVQSLIISLIVPNASTPDPIAIQIGSVTTLTLQGPSVSMGMSISDPTNFYNLINGIQDPVPNNYMGH